MQKGGENSTPHNVYNQLVYLAIIKNLFYATDCIFQIENYFRSTSIYATNEILTYFSMLIFSMLNYLFTIYHFDFTAGMCPLKFLKYRLLSIAYLESYFLLFLFFTSFHEKRYFCGVIYAAIILDIIFEILVFIFTHIFNPPESLGIGKHQINAKNDVLNLYSFHASILAFIFLIIIFTFQMCARILGANFKIKIFYIIGDIFWYFLAVRSFAAHFYMVQVMRPKTKLCLRFLNAIIFLYLTSPCLILCLLVRSLHLLFISLYLLCVSCNEIRFQKALARWRYIKSTLHWSGENSAIEQFIRARIEPLGITQFYETTPNLISLTV